MEEKQSLKDYLFSRKKEIQHLWNSKKVYRNFLNIFEKDIKNEQPN